VAKLSQQNIPIVSGLALGIDAIAHQTALDYNGRTLAVLGSGLSQQNIYPSANRYLAQKILAEGGLIISEYPPATLALQGHFPQRNRIIAGLSIATLVIEAPQQSGALITAKCALEFNRDVLAVPGDIYNSNAQGTNNLIKLGAKLVSSAEDVLEVLNMQNAKQIVEAKKVIPDSLEEELILEHLSNEPVHINQLIKLSGLPTSVVNSTLLLMEMKGKVRHLGGQMYVKGR
jgi:DNA processing protein